MSWACFKDFIAKAFSEDGSPSSSRIIAGWLCVSSMALIWWCLKHAMNLDKDAAAVWVNGMPYIIGALAAFTTAPYGVAKAGQTLMEIFKKKQDEGDKG